MIKLQRLGHVLISVRDLEKSKDFYTRLLGFKVLEQDPDHGGLFLSIGGLGNTFDLFQCTNPEAVATSDEDLAGRNGLGVRHIAFAVETEDDLRDAYFALQSAGVAILRAIDHVSQKSIYFHDPDKNLLEIVWERPNALEIFARGRGDEDKPLDVLLSRARSLRPLPKQRRARPPYGRAIVNRWSKHMADLHTFKDGLVVTAFWEAKPDEVDAVQSIVRQFLPQAQREPGVKAFQIHQSTSEPHKFFFYEVFKDEAAFADHQQTDHFKTLIVGQAVPKLAKRERTQHRFV